MLVNGFEVAVDPAALADMEHAEEAARAHAAAMASAGGKCTVASHGAQMANGGKCTVASHGAQMANGGIATMSGEHAPGIQSAGGTAGLGKKRGSYKMKKTPHQTAAQAARAEKMRARYRAASRAAGAH